MAFAVAAAFVVHLTALAGGGTAFGQTPAAEASPQRSEQPGEADRSLSPECRVPGSQLYTLASLTAVKAALKEHRAVRVLAIGSSSTAGVGASSPQATYPARLAGELERLFPNVEIEVVNRGLSGEIAGEAAERMRNTVVDVDPDLVVWQVGTNDALARIEVETFADSLDETIQWLKSHDIDVVLVDPQYTASLARDDYYSRMVKAIEEVARKDGVLLVRRFEAMRYLAGERKTRGRQADQFHLNELSYRCMAEHVALAITVSLLQADTPADRSSLDTSTAKVSPPK